MAHNLDITDGIASFVSANGEDAWHRLGTVVPQEGLTAAEVMDLAHLGGWNVRKRPLFTEDEDGNTIAIPGRVAIVRTNPINGKVQAIAPAGKEYGIVQNEQHAAFLDTLVAESGAHFTTAGALYENGRQVFITMKLPGHVKIGGEDLVENYIAAVNSHDGSKRFTIMVTPVRVVCANTLNFALKNHKKLFAVRHTSGALKGIAQAAREALDMSFEYLDDFQVQANQLIDTTFTQSQFEELIEREFGVPEDATASKRTRAAKKIDEMTELFAEAQTQKGIADTKWAAVNALAEWWDHYSPTRGADADAVRARKALLSTKFKDKALQLVLAA